MVLTWGPRGSVANGCSEGNVKRETSRGKSVDNGNATTSSWLEFEFGRTSPPTTVLLPLINRRRFRFPALHPSRYPQPSSNMDDNPFANPFADDADPTANPFASSGSGIQSPALASYTSGFDAASRRVSIASAGEHVYPTAASSAGGQADTEESPYLRKLEQDGVISGITSPSAAFQGNPFSSAVSPIARTAQNDDIDAFKGGFYSPPAFSPVNPSSSQDQAFGIGESAVIGSPSQSTNDEGPRRVQGASQATTTHQDDLEALGLAPAADPPSTLKAAFIKHPAPRPRETPGPQEPEQMGHTSPDTASPSTKRTPSIQPATRPAEGTSAGARRRKKVVGISVDNVERERERERERLERERAEREVARKEGEEREKAERERREREGPKEEERRTDAALKLEENTTTPLNGEPTIPTPESQPVISSTTAEQILLSSDPHQTSQAIAQQLDPTDEDEDGLRTLPPLPASEGNTRTATPEPVTEPPRSTGSPATMRLEKMIGSPSAPHAHSHHPGIVRSHLDPVVTSPLDGSANADVGSGFQSLTLGGSTARDEPRRSATWGRAFDEDDSNEVQPPSSVVDGPVSAGWTTELPSGGSLATGGGWTSPGAQGGDGWGAKDAYSTQVRKSKSSVFVAHSFDLHLVPGNTNSTYSPTSPFRNIHQIPNVAAHRSPSSSQNKATSGIHHPHPRPNARR